MSRASDEIGRLVDAFGRTETAMTIVALIAAFALGAFSAAKVLWRIGLGLARRRIALLASSDDNEVLRGTILDSGIFAERNLIEVRKIESLERAAEASVWLLHWPSWHSHFDQVLAALKPRSVLLVYAPAGQSTLPSEVMARLNQLSNVALVNFRGRLLNDLVTSLITTSVQNGK